MDDHRRRTLALFYCRNVPESQEHQRQALEEKYGETLRLFPIPCSGRLDPIHLLRALEEFADAAYVAACAEGTCRYFEGNLRAMKRVERTRWLIHGIGLEEDRVGVVAGSLEGAKSLARQAEDLFEKISKLPPSPVHQWGRLHRLQSPPPGDESYNKEKKS